jgi:hypothetical protein
MRGKFETELRVWEIDLRQSWECERQIWGRVENVRGEFEAELRV